MAGLVTTPVAYSAEVPSTRTVMCLPMYVLDGVNVDAVAWLIATPFDYHW
jgi:hypothetical protein